MGDEAFFREYTKDFDLDELELYKKESLKMVYGFANNDPTNESDFLCMLCECIYYSDNFTIERIPGSKWWYHPWLKWRCVDSFRLFSDDCNGKCSKQEYTIYSSPIFLFGVLACTARFDSKPCP